MKTDGLKSQRIRSGRAFTLLELMIAITVIAILMGLLMPALNMIRKLALEAKQKAQIASIEIGLSLYKNDFGDYPVSHGYQTGVPNDYNDYYYSGAQTLSEAMFGQDLLGVHPNTDYRYTGYAISGATNALLYPLPSGAEPNATNISVRKGPYLDRSNIGVFEPNQVFVNVAQGFIDMHSRSNYMICDVFTTHSKTINGKNYKIGSPILYYKANPSAVNTQLIRDLSGTTLGYHASNIYNYTDNYDLLVVAKQDGKGQSQKFINAPPDGKSFYNFISDPMIPVSPTPGSCGRPVRPDTYLLISAGYDGIFGTNDDVCNFSPNIK